MIRKTFHLALAATLLAGMTITGCQKQLSDSSSDQVEQTLQSSEDDAEAEATFNDVADQAVGTDSDAGLGQIDLFAGANGVSTDNGSGGQEIYTDPNPPAKCFTITVEPKDPLVFPKTITIDYGTGCLGRDGKTRMGKVVTVYSKPMVVPGATATTTFIGYYVDSVKVEGTHITKNNSTSAVLVITRIVKNGKLIKPNGNYIVWNAEHTFTQVAGLGTPAFPRDDEWNITGGATGENNHNGMVTTWSRTILEPLHKAFTCHWIDKGVVKITRNGKEARLNYGNGTCDNTAIISCNGKTREIKLH